MSEADRLMKSLDYELDKIIENSKKTDTATAISLIRQPISLLFLSLLKKLEQKDKRIKELEEELAKYKDIDYIFKIDSNENRVDMKKIYFEWLDSIPRQAVIDELKRLNAMLGRTTEGRIQKYTVNEIIIRSNALQELLEGEKNEL